jgi:hypothetical protein
MPLDKKWVDEIRPLGPPADSTKSTPLDGEAMEDLESRVQYGLDSEEGRAKAAEAAAQAEAEAASDPTGSAATAQSAAEAASVPLVEKGAASGVATLDGTTKLPESQLPLSVVNSIEVRTFTIPDQIKVPEGLSDYIPPFVVLLQGMTAKIIKAVHLIHSGTSATVKLTKNGADLSGFTGISVTPEKQTTNPADQSVEDGDLIGLVVTAISGSPRNMTFTVAIERTLV